MFEKEAEKYASLGGLSKDTHFFGIKALSFKEGADFGYNKCKEEMQKNGLALQSDMDRTIEQNFALKAQIEKMTNTETMLKILKDRGVIRSWYYNGTYHVGSELPK